MEKVAKESKSGRSGGSFGHFAQVGRPSFRPNEEQRRLVKSLAVLGIQQEQICQAMGIRSEKTLRKHFRTELEGGSLHATVNVARTALEMATSGAYPAMTFFWEKCHRDLRAIRLICSSLDLI